MSEGIYVDQELFGLYLKANREWPQTRSGILNYLTPSFLSGTLDSFQSARDAMLSPDQFLQLSKDINESHQINGVKRHVSEDPEEEGRILIPHHYVNSLWMFAVEPIIGRINRYIGIKIRDEKERGSVEWWGQRDRVELLFERDGYLDEFRCATQLVFESHLTSIGQAFSEIHCLGYRGKLPFKEKLAQKEEIEKRAGVKVETFDKTWDAMYAYMGIYLNENGYNLTTLSAHTKPST